MSVIKKSLASSSVAAISLCTGTPSFALEYDFYGSIRVHGEYVSPDDDQTMDSYTGWRDAYSRLGVNAKHAFNDQITAYAKLELPLDIPNKAVQDPWDQDEDIRVGKIGVKGAFGDISVGQMWMPYYNAIAYPVDMFSSYYSGFATYTTFRKGDTLAYYSPRILGLSGSFGYSLDNGASDSNGDMDDRVQGTLSYQYGDITVSGGFDHLGGSNDATILGTSLMWQLMNDLYIGAKYEQHKSDIDSGYGADGDHAMNLYAGYTLGQNTFKAMVADVEHYGETILHLGWDYQYQEDLKFFVEYYQEDETAAITQKYGGMNETCWSCNGGQVVAAGLRYDFGAP
ncbi:MAG: porin [Candidatus Thiodiazotropha sp.]